MSRFASKEVIAVHADDEPRDTIYIHAQANLGMQRRINKRFLQMRQEMGGANVVLMDPTEYNFAVLTEFIVRWEGPGFEGRKFSEAALAELDADDPFIVKVLGEIQRLNPRFADEEDEASPNSPKSSEPDGASGSGATSKKTQASGTSTS